MSQADAPRAVAVIDDDPVTLELISAYFAQDEQVRISPYAEPQAALGGIRAGRFDLVILDIVLPRSDGIEILQEIKGAAPQVKVIMITGESTVPRVLKSHKWWADGYLTKPFHPHDLGRLVRQHLGLAG